MDHKQILVTGATGYIGGRLIPKLLERGYHVRCLARDPRKLAGRWTEYKSSGQLTIARGDVLDRASLSKALQGVDAAYYLVHAMGDKSKGFAERDRAAAKNFADAAEEQGVGRILYLGGLGKKDRQDSPHLRSRHETGDLLRAGATPVTELRAAMIVGAGSASFEMLRYLTERLPLMICPRWAVNRTQPICIADALAYLVASLECPEAAGQVLDIGGPEIMTYRDMMLNYARIRGKRRAIFIVPVLTPHLSAYWVALITPVPASIAFPIVEGLRSETICENDKAQRLLHVPLTPFREAVLAALREEETAKVPTRWADADRRGLSKSLKEVMASGMKLLTDKRTVRTSASAGALRRAYSRIGGHVGWYYADWLWDVRGEMDRLIGGVGLRRGRTQRDLVAVGDAIDFWRVEEYDSDRMLLHAEMKVPGSAWLEFRVQVNDDGTHSLIQTAYYLPGSVWGKIYWYGLLAIHHFVFSGMARGVVREAERQQAGDAKRGRINGLCD